MKNIIIGILIAIIIFVCILYFTKKPDTEYKTVIKTLREKNIEYQKEIDRLEKDKSNLIKERDRAIENIKKLSDNDLDSFINSSLRNIFTNK